MKHLNLTLIALLLSFISFGQAPVPITGTLTVCPGSVDTLSDGTTGGTWASSASGTATVNSTSGYVTGVVPGTATITYTTTGGSANATVTVNPGPGPISGVGIICYGATETLIDGTSAGTWSSSNTSAATIDSVSGMVFGEGGGSATISYTLSSSGCSVTFPLIAGSLIYTGYSVNASNLGIACSGTPGAYINTNGSSPGINYQLYYGASAIGAPMPGTGDSIYFGPFTTGGTYTVVAVNPSTGCSVVLGSATITAAASPAVYAVTITGTGAYCIGSTPPSIGLGFSDAGISYQLYDGSAAVGAALTGTGAPLNYGPRTTAGAYYVIAFDPSSGCTTDMGDTVTVTPNPVPALFSIGAGGGYCRGTSGLPVTLAGSTTGISYQLYDDGTALGTPIVGTGAPLNFGFDTSGVYTIVATNTATGCTSNMLGAATISSTLLTPTVSIGITPGGVICNGSTVGFSASPVNGGATPAYTWSVNGASAGTGDTYVYVPANGDVVSLHMISSLPCATPDSASTSTTLSIDVPSITASSSSACGGDVSLVASGGVSYTWAPSAGLACATCDTVTLNPSSTVVFTLTGTDIYGCVGTTTITADGNRISGHISGISTFGSIRVWLIQFSPTDSSMVTLDSTMACLDDGTPYYEFDNAPVGSYVVKAEVLGGVPGSSGYIPTYGFSNPHWAGSSGIVHGSGTDTMHITMLYGIIYPGPGYISGYIVSGAARATTEAPAAGMLVYLQDAISGNVLTYTYTNSVGLYAFSHLQYSNYIVYPEQYDYYTLPGYVITLDSTNQLVYNIDFRQHTSYRAITPYITPAAVNPLSSENGINVYPNPTSGNLNIKWTNQVTGSADVVITDVVGREVYKSAISINDASGQTQIGLDGLKDGIYLIHIQSANINYTGKLMIQR